MFSHGSEVVVVVDVVDDVLVVEELVVVGPAVVVVSSPHGITAVSPPIHPDPVGERQLQSGPQLSSITNHASKSISYLNLQSVHGAFVVVVGGGVVGSHGSTVTVVVVPGVMQET